jgi:hypothetical protein
MNAIPPIPREAAAERTARHLDQCKELADLSMQLARKAAQKALQEADSGEEPEPDAPKKPNNTLLFTRLAACARATIALEARIANAHENLRQTFYSPKPDPRRAPVREAFRQYTADMARPTAILRMAESELEDELLHEDMTVADLFLSICEKVGINFDYDDLSNELLAMNDPSPILHPPKPS